MPAAPDSTTHHQQPTIGSTHAYRTKHRARTWFDAWARNYDRSLLNYFLFRPSYLTMLEEIAKWRTHHRAAFRLLDVGCGTATFAKRLMRTGWPVSIIGLDYSPAMCVQAEEKMRVQPRQSGGAERVSPEIIAGDSEHLPFDDAAFDIVTCANSFHHYPHQQAVVTEMHRVLRPGGRLILLDGFRDNVIGWVTYDVIVTGVERDVHHASWREIDGFMRHAGFRDIQRRKVNIFCPILATTGEV